MPAEAAALAEEMQAVPISALTGAGLAELLARVEAELYAALVPLKVTIPYKAGQFISLFHEQGIVEHTEHLETGVLIEGRVPERVVERFKPYLAKAKGKRAPAGKA
jgi:GTP-binding protein HflX